MMSHRLSRPSHVALAVALLGLAGSASAQIALESPRALTLPDLWPSGLAAADLDGDGDDDLLVSCNSFPAQRFTLLNDGTGTYVQGPLSESGSAYYFPQLGDLDGDGVVDLLAHETSLTETLIMRRGLDNGDFAPKETFGVDYSFTGLELADLDVDGDLDVLSTSLGLPFPIQFIGGLQAFLNDGDGGLSQSFEFITPLGFQAMAVGDIDADGDPDVMGANLNAFAAQYDLYRFRGNGAGSFDTPTLLGGLGPGIRLVDMNAAEILALVALNTARDGLSLYEGETGGFFGKPTTTPLGYLSNGLQVGDLDGDGTDELLVVSFGESQRELHVFGSDGALGLEPRLTLSKAEGPTPLLTDFDGDGLPDLILGNGLEDELHFVDNATYGLDEPFLDLGAALAGSEGWPVLVLEGDLEPGEPVTVRVSNGPPGGVALMVLGLSRIDQPFQGGLLVPRPDAVADLLTVPADGRLEFVVPWPEQSVRGSTFFTQFWFLDPAAPTGWAATTAVRGRFAP